MIVRQLKAVLRPFKARLVPNFNDYLGKVDGLVHVGANTGQERDLYESYGLEVIWIEPIPDVFAELQENIKGHPRQSAYQELIDRKSTRLNSSHSSVSRMPSSA